MQSLNQRDPAMVGSGKPRIENDAYFTIEPWITRVLVKELRPYNLHAIWEPASGAGHMVEELQNLAPVFASDLIERPRFKDCSDYTFEQHDFLKVDLFENRLQELKHGGFPLEAIITNPPYEKTLCESFVRQAVAYLERPHSPVQIVAMLLRNDWCSAKSRADLFRDNLHFSRKIVLTTRPRWIQNTDGAPRFNYAWYVWAKKQVGPPSITWRGKVDGQ